MGDEDLEARITEFLDKADAAYREYEQGYANADATLRKLQNYIETLQDTIDSNE